MTVINRVLRPS